MANWPGYKHGHPPSHAPYPNLGIRYMAASAPILRANAAGKLAMGVHEIEQFNFFCTDQPNIPGLRADYGALRGVHDLAFLRGKPKHYCLSSPSGRRRFGRRPSRYPPFSIRRTAANSAWPCAPNRGGTRLAVQVVTERTAQPARLGISFNVAWPCFESRQNAGHAVPGRSLHSVHGNVYGMGVRTPFVGDSRGLEYGHGDQQYEESAGAG
jgi:hypothetical protein